jgi:IS4 transposase
LGRSNDDQSGTIDPQIIEYYGACWKIEVGFKELKQDIGSQKNQCRNGLAVTNHLSFCMMAVTVPGSILTV